jgi:hypothetical protein
MTNCIFEPRTDTSSATICKHCGQEKFLHIQLPQQETLYTEEQVREAIRMSRVTNTTNVIGGGVKLHTYSDNEIIQSLKQPKQ